MNFQSVITELGQPLRLKCAGDGEWREFTGIIHPIMGSGEAAIPTPPGITDRRKYLLVAPPEVFCGQHEGCRATVSGGGMLYELLRAEPMTLAGEITHWEGVLRKVGRDAND